MEHTVDKQHMDALKALSDMNLKVSEVRALLTELEETETTYLVAREEKAMVKVREVVESSRLLLSEVSESYASAKEIADTASTLVETLKEANVSFCAILESFEEKSNEWNAKVLEQQSEIDEMRKEIVVGRQKLQNEKESMSSELRDLQDKTKILRDREGILNRNTERVVRQELDVHEKVQLIEKKEEHLVTKVNALKTLEVKLSNREESIKAGEERLARRERALNDKYASLDKTLKELST